MSQLVEIWTGLDARRRLGAVLGVLAFAATLVVMGQIAARPHLTLLYGQLDESAAGEIVRALEQRGVPHEVRNGAIFVPSDERDSLRMTLAAEGLPANGPKGYELLDSLSGFGTTAQMFDAAYWRAKEGELARTILASPGVSAARVHIAPGGQSPFRRDEGATASVFVTSTNGSIDADLARALRFLVASAVPQLGPDDVSIIDSTGRLVTSEALAAAAGGTTDRADDLRDRVQRLVVARVGRGNAVVEVAVDTVTETENILERLVNPDQRVAISVDTEERSRESEGSAAGLTVASNLPDGEGAAGDGNRSQDSETRERINYEVSETTREISRGPGAIRRITVAVLVNGTVAPDDQGIPRFAPLPEAELESLRELVAAAVGYDEARGDRITIRSMQFEELPASGTAGQPLPWYERLLDVMSLARIAVLGLVALLIGLFVLRPLLAPRPPVSDFARLGAPASAAPAEDLPLAEDAPLMAMSDSLGTDLPMLVGGGGFGDAMALDDSAEDDPVDRLRALIEARKDETVEVLRTWLEEKEQA